MPERELVPGDVFIYESYASETYPFDASEMTTHIVAYKKQRSRVVTATQRRTTRRVETLAL